MKTNRKTQEHAETKATRAPRKAKSAKDKGQKRTKKADIIELPPEAKPSRSVVQPTWKAKAGKTGIWKSDKIRDAVTSAFLREENADTDKNAAARKATDKILTENGLDEGRWAGKNNGMLSMNLGNVLRGVLRNDGVVFVYGKKIEA